LITVTGYPCSGKSTRTEQFRAYIQNRIEDKDYEGSLKSVVVISDDSLNISRTSYDDAKQEKVARATFYTALQRELNRNTVVIADSLNYIKGYRYQMYCAARELSIRVTTVFTAATPEVCKERYQRISETNSTYNPSTFDNLIMRYEEPSSMARWDSPLFTIPWTDEADSLPYEILWKAITQGDVKPPNAGTVGAPKAPTDALQVLEQTTNLIVQSIMAEQTASGVGGGSITFMLSSSDSSASSTSASTEPLKLVIELPSRHIGLPELQRHKRQFVNTHKKAVVLGSTEKGNVEFSTKSIAERFGSYLETHVQ